MNIGINKKTILSNFYWYWIWLEKASFIPAVVANDRDPTNFTRHFQGGSPSSQGDTDV